MPLELKTVRWHLLLARPILLFAGPWKRRIVPLMFYKWMDFAFNFKSGRYSPFLETHWLLVVTNLILETCLSIDLCDRGNTPKIFRYGLVFWVKFGHVASKSLV